MDIIGTTVERADGAPSLPFITGAFLSRYPPSTRQTYWYTLRRWFGWCELHNVDPLHAQRGHIEAYGRHLAEERGLKVSSIAQHIKAICGLYHYAHVDGFITVDPGAHVRRPKVEFVSSTNGLTKDEATELLWRSKLLGPTACALIHVLLMNGTRIGETLAADIEHLGRQGEHRTLFLPHRKGGKTGLLGLADTTCVALDKAIGDRRSGPVFLGRDGQRMKPEAARRIVARLTKKCGITKRITPHSLRHSFVTLALDAGVSARDLMDSTGHSNPIMLTYYDRSRGVVSRNATFTVANLFDPSPAVMPIRPLDRDGFPLDLYPAA